MESLKFEEGYKELAINGDETRILRFNPTDVNLVERFEKFGKEMENLRSEINNVADFEGIESTIIKGIDDILGEGSSKIIFGEQSPLSPIKGRLLYEVFFEDAFIPYIKKQLDEEKKNRKKVVEKYKKEIQNDR